VDGIVGIVGKSDVASSLIESLLRIKGTCGGTYGLAALDDEMRIDLRTDEGPRVRFGGFGGTSSLARLAIAHTRQCVQEGEWEKACPHLSCDRSFAVAHSGLISNCADIERALRRERGNHFFFSDTDTEVITHLLEEMYRPGMSIEQAFVRMLRHLEGVFAIAVISTHEPRKIFCARQRVPLTLGIDSETKFVGSDINVFLPHIRQRVPLDDGEYAVLLPDGYWIKDIANGEQRNGRGVTQIL
jgi:glucosamine--fructose-6-phosphate aminotransferase (isomerizing)